MSNENTYDIRILRGKYIVNTILGIFVISQIISVFIGNPNILRIIVYSLLFLITYQGYKWARIVLGILYFAGSLFGVVASLFLMADYNSSTVLIVGLLASMFSLFSSLFLLSSKDVILFLKQDNPKDHDYNPLDLTSREVSELGEKLQKQNDKSLPNYKVMTALEIPHTDDKIFLLDYSMNFRNIIRCKNDGLIIWKAELPSENDDAYTNLEWKNQKLTAFSKSCITVIIDVETGKIISG